MGKHNEWAWLRCVQLFCLISPASSALVYLGLPSIPCTGEGFFLVFFFFSGVVSVVLLHQTSKNDRSDTRIIGNLIDGWLQVRIESDLVGMLLQVNLDFRRHEYVNACHILALPEFPGLSSLPLSLSPSPFPRFSLFLYLSPLNLFHSLPLPLTLSSPILTFSINSTLWLPSFLSSLSSYSPLSIPVDTYLL